MSDLLWGAQVNRRAFVLGAVMVLLGSFVAVALRSFAEAEFLVRYGARQMPWLLIANASGFAAATLGYDALTRVARAATVDIALLCSLAIAAGLAPWLLARGAPAAAIVVALAAASQVAGLALWNRVCAAVAGRDARRYLPRAGAAVTLGGAIAGLGSGALIPRLGLSAIPYIGAVTTVIAIGVCIVQERALVRGGAPGGSLGAVTEASASGAAAASAGPTGASVAPTGALTSVQRSLVRAMVAVAILEAMVTTVIDLQFIDSVKSHFAGQDVAVTLALFYGVTNALLFVLQSAAVPHLLVTRAMTFTAAVHPVIVILSYAAFAVTPGFGGIAGTRTADQVLRFATSRTSQETELSALAPAPRARLKVLLRGAVWPLGVAIAALALLLVGAAALRAPGTLAVVAIGVAVAWAVAARVAARRFQRALAAPLRIQSQRTEDPRRIDLATLERWTHRAGADDAAESALARAALERAHVDATDLAEHLRHDDPTVRAALFDQLARESSPSLRAELRTAVAIEDDDRALALGIKALAIAGDASGIERGKQRAGLSLEVDRAVMASERLLGHGDAVLELRRLLAEAPDWVVPLLRSRRADLSDEALAEVLRAACTGTTRAAALHAIAHVGPAGAAPVLADALADGDPAAIAAIETLDETGATALAREIPSFASAARTVLARLLAATPAGAALLGTLVDDPDPDVAHAALRSALAVIRGGVAFAADRITAAHDATLAALDAHLDARDATVHSGGKTWSACARAELEVATRRCIARLLWAAALEAAAAGRDPAPLAASARRLLGAREADRRRTLDVVQELLARPQALASLERWMQPPRASGDASRDERALARIGEVDPWIARLRSGELSAVEPTLVDLRRAPLFASLAGPALAELATTANRLTIRGDLFRAGTAGDEMYVITRGELAAARDREPDGGPTREIDRRVGVGQVVGELAVLTHRARVATLTAIGGDAEVLAIGRAAFSRASRRAPELVLGLSSTLAAWLAPTRPDVV